MADIDILANDALVSYTATPGQTVFPYDFPIFTALQLVALKVVGIIETPLVYITDYTLTGVGEEAGGSLVLTVPCVGGERIILERVTPLVRTADFQLGGDIDSAELNKEFDYVYMILQEAQRDQLTRVLHLPDAAPDTFSTTLPLPVANLLLGVRSDGLAFEMKTLPVGSAVYATIANTRLGTAAAEAVTPDGLAQFWQKGADIASAATLAKPTDGNLGGYHVVTGAITVANLWTGDPIGTEVELEFNGSRLSHSASLLLPALQDIVTVAGEVGRFRYTAVGVWKLMSGPARWYAPRGRNRLINPGFVRFDNGDTNNNGGICHDGWYQLFQTGTLTRSYLIDPEDGTLGAARLVQAQAAPQRFGIAQVLEAAECKDMRGGQATISARVKVSTPLTLKYAILGWSGTQDSPTKNVVLDWTSASYVAGGFFLAANVQVLAVGTFAVPNTNWNDLPALTATLGSTFNNLYMFVWTEAAAAQNVELQMGRPKLEKGAFATYYEQPERALEAQRWARFYEESADQDLGTTSMNGASQFVARTADQLDRATAFFKATKFRAPTVTLYPPAGAAVAGNVRNITAGTDIAGVVESAGKSSCVVRLGVNAVVASRYGFHWEANATIGV